MVMFTAHRGLLGDLASAPLDPGFLPGYPVPQGDVIYTAGQPKVPLGSSYDLGEAIEVQNGNH